MVIIKAILFGSIGTVVETSEFQRRAFNQAFSEVGLSWSWGPDVYKRLLAKSGGRERIEFYASQHGIDVDANKLHKRKTEIFDDFMKNEMVTLRPGVPSMINYARDQNLKLAFVTTTLEANIDSVFFALGDQLLRDNFDFIGNNSLASSPKPSPDIYREALSKLCLGAQDCIAIEDTEISMKAAIAADIRCIAFPGEFSSGNNFNGALLVTDKLSPLHLKA